jgi:beta-glucosidase
MSEETPVFRDPKAPIESRVEDLLARMTLEEKIGQMIHNAPAIDRLGIPAYVWWSECLHGVARNGRATVFPQAIGLAAMWDTDLVQRIANAIGDEGRAKHHAAARAGKRGQCQGLTFWSPNVNIFRDPRWGRGQETYGEDPFLAGELGAAFVRGLQGDNPDRMKAAACAKHFAVHSGPEGDRHGFNAVVSPKDLHETYLPAFRRLVEEGVEAIMGAYNRTNDEPCCGSQLLLDDILRGQWGFEGHVVSDCGAIGDFHAHHKVTSTPEESAALALKHGCDLNCGEVYLALLKAHEKGLITEEQIDVSLGRLLRTRFKLGLLDPPGGPFEDIPVEVIDCEAHRVLALEAAAKSLVLLKNDGVLPLRNDLSRIFVTGPYAAGVDVLLGNYYGMSARVVTFVEGLVGRAEEGTAVEYRPGVLDTMANLNPIDWATGEARNSDVIVAVVGIDPKMEGEEGESIASPYTGDRTDIALPAHQSDYVVRLCDTGKPVVLVVTGGSPVAIGDLHDRVAAVVFAWYPGEEGGTALAQVLFGDQSPSGKLPLTFPRDVEQLPPFEDYAMTGRTYRYMTDDPLYPFGFGLSYTTFEYTDLSLEAQKVHAGQTLRASVTVRNTGDREGEEVAQAYLTDLEASVDVPLHRLVQFARVRIASGAERRVEFAITPEMMSLIDQDGHPQLEPGRFRLTIGGAAPCSRSEQLGAPTPAIAEFDVAEA